MGLRMLFIGGVVYTLGVIFYCLDKVPICTPSGISSSWRHGLPLGQRHVLRHSLPNRPVTRSAPCVCRMPRIAMLSKRQSKDPDQPATRHGRKKSDVFIAEGWRCCEEALRRRPEWLEALFCSAAAQQSPRWPTIAALAVAAGCEPVVVAERDFAALTDTENPQGLLSAC